MYQVRCYERFCQAHHKMLLFAEALSAGVHMRATVG
ncbi:hypothetical protein J2Z28_002505, partial [Paenibacillus xylanexedens]|nr:hypothetical protein [Paenibacillus xylanexedens]